jgi:hypothetical protein
MAPHMPFGTPYAFVAPHLPFGAPFSFQRPNFMAPHLPFGAQICLNGAPFAFWCPHLPVGTPICLLQVPSAFWFPNFFEKTHDTICPAAKRGPGFKFPGCNLWMIQSSCAMINQLDQLLLQFLQHLSHVSGCALNQVIFLFGHIRESSLLDLLSQICFGNVPRMPNIWLGKHTQKLCPLACLV